MPAKKTTQKKQTKKTAAPPPKRREIGALICLILAIFTFIGFFSGEGWFIDFFRVFVRGIIGPGFYALVPVLLYCAFILAFHRGRPVRLRLICALLVPLVFGALMHLFVCVNEYKFQWTLFGTLYKDGLASGTAQSGGIFGGIITMLFRTLFGKAGAAIVLICGLIFLVFAAMNVTLTGIIDWYKTRPVREYIPEPEISRPREQIVKQKKPRKLFDAQEDYDETTVKKEPKKSITPLSSAIDIPVDEPKKLPQDKPSFFDSTPGVKTPDQVLTETTQVKQPKPEPLPVTDERAPAKITREESEKAKAEVAESIEKTIIETETLRYVFPTPELLAEVPHGNMVDGREEMALNASRLDATIKSFGISAGICNITRGPSVTRYEVELEQGIKLSNLTRLADDIALSLGVTGVRIAPIPDKISIVGIEVPNKLVNVVCFREIIESSEFKNSSAKLSFAIGKDIGGNPVVGDIAKLTHLLVAGTTGSGKSVCMNSLILSILFKASPDEVRLIMIDPKMIEMGVYNGIPHLLIPVVTDPKKASGALQWAVTEMMRRYKLFSEIGAQNLAAYNQKISQQNESELQPENGHRGKMPQIVVLVDELADLMLVAKKEVEDSIVRIAQMGRASGIHMVIATQRPSADVITGIMKANIPSRIAFAVDSALNSRIILDTTGAEKLVGKGDMLYAPLGSGKPQRLQGAFVTDQEREDVIAFVKERSSAQYSSEVLSEIEKTTEPKDSAPSSDKNESGSMDDYDELFAEAVGIVLESKQASVSMLQRRLKLGYSRAARLVDQMEEYGVVGPFEGSKPRQLLVTKAQWLEMQGIEAPEEIPEDDDA